MDPVDEVLAHYGVKGMKWGVRRARGSDGRVTSSDAARASTAKSVVKKNGVQALSNDDLQILVTRLNLERQLNTLQPPASTKAKKVVGDILLNAGKQQASKAINDAIGKLIAKKLAGR